ncbi:MAG: flavin reductase family protein, partial [Pseudomonadota bacterium]|nr:flavin reductase family protein [Pseudomonadota bacterium]
LVLFCIDRGATCYDAFAAADFFAVNILREDQQDISDVFANGDGDRFAGLAVDRSETGAPILTAGLAAMDCQIHDRHDGGDHDILVGRVLRLSTGAAAAPLVYFGGRYQALAAD